MENGKIIHIVAGGPKELIPDLKQFQETEVQWIGVDRGVYYLLQANIIPNISVGDFDSVSEREWEIIEQSVDRIERYVPEKDETDMELAFIWAMKQKPSKIRVFGATGGRMDHTLANIFMLVHYQKLYKISLEIIDQQNNITVFYPGTYTISLKTDKKYISFIPLTASVEGLNLSGFKYPLMKKTVPFGSSLCMSNELIQETGTFSFEKGILMMIRSTD